MGQQTIPTPSVVGAGLTPYRNIDLGTTGQVVKASGGKLFGWFMANNAAASRRVKVYDKATAPTSGDTPKMTLTLPAGAASNIAFDYGIEFQAGISVRATVGQADNDNTAPTASDVEVNLFYV